MAASGALTAEEFELRYAKPTGKIHLSGGLWSRYLRGETLPQGATTHIHNSLVNRLDTPYPGTKDIFLHPVWELLDFDQLLGPDQLLEKYRCLDEEIWTQFVDCQVKGNPNEPSVPLAFWPLVQSEAARKARLQRLSGLDGIAACFIEARMGYLAQTEDRFVHSLLVAGRHFQRLAKLEPFLSPRMQSALLAMEAHGIAFVNKKMIDVPPGSEVHRQFRSSARSWSSDWIAKSKRHLKKLSPSSNRTLRDWLKTVLQRGVSESNSVRVRIAPKSGRHKL
jgi:hypothetical protein